jgi:hypothetical protein
MKSTPGVDGTLTDPAWTGLDTPRGGLGFDCWASPDIAKVNSTTAATTAIRNSIERFIDLDLLHLLEFDVDARAISTGVHSVTLRTAMELVSMCLR